MLAQYLRFSAIGALLPFVVMAQAPHINNLPLKNWPAPAYWHPPQLPESQEVAEARQASLSPQVTLPTQPLAFVAMTPCRVIDTRAGAGFPSPFGAPSLMALTPRSFPLQSSTACQIPPTALAYSLNVTVTPIPTPGVNPPGYLGFLTVYPTGAALPNSSTLNNYLGTVVSNASIVPAGDNGSITAYAHDATDMIVDINGYYVQNSLISNQNVNNTAVGFDALLSNTTGSGNTAIGKEALVNNTTGIGNTATGDEALFANTIGSYNIGIGALSGFNITNGNYNIMIGSRGATVDDHVIRIGDVQFQTFIAGISGVNVSGVPVLVSSSGQLGVASSSRRFKQDIADMGDSTSNLMRLRPVTYRYKQPFEDGSQPLQYGLIAEEVAEVYPELVARSADGQIETVKYQLLDSMLLNEVQRLHVQNVAQHKANESQAAEITAQREKIRALEDRLARIESRLAAPGSK